MVSRLFLWYPTSIMKELLLSQVIDLLESSAAVIVDDRYVTFANTFGVDEDDDEAFFLELAETDEAANSGESLSFKPGDNHTVPVNEKGELVLTNSYGDKTTVTLLARNPIKL